MIVVLGSVNADVVLQTPHLPAPGETLRARTMRSYPGGKGGNQAVAAARMGATVELVGRVGRDANGAQLVEALHRDGVGTSGVFVDETEPTGTALITVAGDGSNTIVTVGGANHRIGDAELAEFERLLSGAKLVCVQLEVPIDVVETAVTLAGTARVPVMCDPAPVVPLPDPLYRMLEWITPNEHEAAVLTGHDEPVDAASDLAGRGVRHVVVTLQDRGALYLGPDGSPITIEAPLVTAVDTVACGDAFNGCLAARSVAGDAPLAALRRACAAGAAAATVAGASPSLPFPAAVDRLLDRENL